MLGVSEMSVIRLIKDQSLPAKQCCPGSPYVIRREDLERPAVRQAVENGRAVSQDCRQETLQYE